MRRRKAELEWTNAAEIHLEEIRAYIARDSAMQAVRFIARIRKAVERLRDFPRSGEVLDFEAQKELREIYVKKYRVVFRVSEQLVRVIAVIHGSRDFALFEKHLENDE